MEKTTHFYRQGFRDAQELRPYRQDIRPNTFAEGDYALGYWAGFNGLYWDAIDENKRRDAKVKA